MIPITLIVLDEVKKTIKILDTDRKNMPNIDDFICRENIGFNPYDD